MDAYIKFEGNVTDEVSYDLIQLGNILEQECDVSVKFDKQEIQSGVGKHKGAFCQSSLNSVR